MRQRELALVKNLHDVASLIRRAGVPVTRRWVEAVLTHDHRRRPDSVTEALTRFENDDHKRARVQIDFWDVGDSAPMKVYAYDRAATEKEADALVRLVRLRQEVERATVAVGKRERNALGHAGELFVRGALLDSKAFHVPTRITNLGRASSGFERESVDLIAEEFESKETYGVEVKNEREWLHRISPHFNQVTTAAAAAKLKPMLVAAFAIPEAYERARKSAEPVRLTILGTRIAPKVMLGRQTRLIIEELRPIIGPEPWAFIGDRFEAPRPWVNPFAA